MKIREAKKRSHRAETSLTDGFTGVFLVGRTRSDLLMVFEEDVDMSFHHQEVKANRDAQAWKRGEGKEEDLGRARAARI